jgi:hypothetical protein
MKRTTMTIAALVVATIASGAAAPAFAQDQAPNDGPRELHFRGPDGEGFMMHRGGPREGMRMRMRGGAGQILALVCSERGADRLEHMLLNIEQRTDPTADQQSLYDTFKSAALDAQADFATTCAAARPDANQAEDADLVDRLKAGLDVQQAHLDAMNAVLPSFEAFFDSLTDEQKQALEPPRRNAEKRFERHMRGPGAVGPEAPTPEQG